MDIEQRIYRTVTSLSYDIVDSTALMQHIGEEEYAVLIEAIHAQYAEIVTKHGGISDLPQGDDGLMCYFGALLSDERAKESALLAALAMQEAAKENNWNVRIGMAYGHVAIYKQQPIGSSIHLAARIQKVAPNRQILVSADLAAQTTKRFAFQLISESLDFKGFDLAPIVFELKEKKLTGQTDLPQAAAQSKIHLYGRQGLLRDLRAVWRTVQTKATGMCLHIVGEPGIGKSTLVQRFIDTSRPSRHSIFLWSCFQEQQQTAYQPLKNALISTINLMSSETQDEKIDKVEKKTSVLGLSQEQKSVVYFLLDLPAPEASLSQISIEDPNAYERRIFQTLLAWLRLESKDFPWLLVVEDMHWADPATVRILTLLKTEIANLQGLLLTTQRPSKTNFPAQAQLEVAEQVIELTRLSYEDASALVGGLCTGFTLDAQEIDWIVERAGGVPLFIQECVRLAKNPDNKKNVKPSNALQSSWFARAESTSSIGNETQEILMQRIDSLGNSRILAQIASAVGSEFRLDVLLLVAGTSGLDDGKLNLLEALEALIQEGILSSNNFNVQQSYGFSHALIRDVAYQSMWASDRKKLHLVILDVYQRHFPDLIKTQPSQMARHWIEAGQYQNAASCLLEAAQQARVKGAHTVSIECCEAILELLQSLPEDELGQKMQLQASLLAAGQIMATQGYGAEGAGFYFRKAMQLSHQLNNDKALDKAQLGLSAYHLTRVEFADAEHHIRTGISSAYAALDPLSLLQWDLSLAMLHFYRGELLRSSELMAQCAKQSSMNPKSHQLIQNPAVVGLIYQAFCLWAMGKTEAACEVAKQSLQLAEHQPLRLSKIQAYGIWAMVLYCRGDWQAALAAAQTALDTSQSGEYELWLNVPNFLAGAAKVRLAMQGNLPQAHIKQGLAQMLAADQSWASKGAVASRTFYLCTLAQCHLDLKNFEAAQGYLDQAQVIVSTNGERYFSTEVQRTQAEFSMATQTSPNWADQAKSLLNQAYEDAIARGLYSFALRIVIAMLDWERLTDKQCKWSSTAKAAKTLLAECLEQMEPFASTADAVLAHGLLHNNTELKTTKAI